MQQSNPADLPLRDIHLPEAVSWWPPAIGWWLLPLLLIFLLLIGWGLKKLLHKRKQQRLFKHSIAEAFATIRNNFADSADQAKLIQDLSTLLRRIALSRYPRADVAALTGQQWLAFLDRTGGVTSFTQGVGSILGSGPYQLLTEEVDAEPLLQLCEAWAKQVIRSDNDQQENSHV